MNNRSKCPWCNYVSDGKNKDEVMSDLEQHARALHPVMMGANL